MDPGEDERGREVRARLLAAASIVLSAAAPASADAATTSGRLLVTLHPSGAARAAAGDVARSAGARAERTVPRLRLVAVRPRAGAAIGDVASALRRDPRVAAVEVERRASLRAEPTDPAWSRQDPVTGVAMQWWAPRLGFPAAWDLVRGDAARVAVIDTGVDGAHPELAGKLLATLDADDLDPGPATEDPVGHGTHVASLACAAPGNGIGLAGAGLGCGLLVARSDLTDSSIARSIVWAADQGAHAIVMAFGTDGGSAPRAMVEAARYAVSRGAVLVAAAADAPVEDQGYPASLVQPDGTGADLGRGLGLSVTAADAGDARADFAGRGSQISVAAYGTFAEDRRPAGLLAAFPSTRTPYEQPVVGVPPRLGCGCRETLDGDDRYGRLQGTSMAAPLVAAAAALVRVQNPDLDVAEVVRLVKETARRPDGAGWTPDLGWGLLDAGALTARAARLDRRAPSSRIRRLAAVTRRSRVRLRWSARDTAGPGIRPSGVTRVEVFRSLDGGPMRRIGASRDGALTARLQRGRRHAFAAVALDAAGNREPLPARPDVVVTRRR